ncbi:MAG: hypothetical protein PGN27_12550 [Mycolicibacterium neoaurum]|uniref:hypothetical protein n=1 Tax=Mycolicibacterium neoaurum TaxID=1795 RepID=UPI002FFA9D9C
MNEPLVLQKLLNAPQATAIVQNGEDQVGGYVVAASAVVGLRTPAETLAAYGVDGAPEFVDVVRFGQPRLTSFSPPSKAERPWPTFASGFLHGDLLAQVWLMSRTRYPFGAEYWRIRYDGEQKQLSRYEGVARGWVGAQRWRPTSPLVGTLARWRGGEFFADVVGDNVLLTAIADQAPPGFELVHPRVWSANRSLSDCEVFERVFTADLEGVPVRVLRNAGARAEVLLLTDDPAAAQRVGAGLVEPEVYEAEVDSSRLANIRGVENQLVIDHN